MQSLRRLHRRLSGALTDHLAPSSPVSCRCHPSTEDGTLHVDATDCSGGGDLATESACRHAVVDALRRNPGDAVRVVSRGRERRYTPASVALLTAAADFAERIAHRDARLAGLAMQDPVVAAREVAGRAGREHDLASATGLLDAAGGHEESSDALRAYEGPSIAASLVVACPPPDASLRDTYDTDTTTVRIYDTPGHPVSTYHVEPLEGSFDADALVHLAAAARVLATGQVDGTHAHHAAVRAAVPDPALDEAPVDDLARVLRKHTAGHGVLDDLFADPAVGDVYANAPADETVLRVIADDEPLRTNVRLTEVGANALAARVRAESGRAFSRANPLVDAVATDVGAAGRVRVAGVTDPVTAGTAYAFRAADDESWRLADLVANDTLPAEAAALLSLSVQRGRRILVAGPRGAGKTTLLAALLWELPPAERVVLLEDTPELPADALQAADRDALALRTDTGDAGPGVAPADALRAALRLGDGALVVGEVRGEEAAVLYEAMRVGANSSAVLGTIHGDGAESVAERVVNDLGVPRSSFAATDLVVTVGHTPTGRRLVAIEEVLDDGFAALYERSAAGVAATPRIRRGNSRFVAQLARPDESYADVRAHLGERADAIASTTDRPGNACPEVRP